MDVARRQVLQYRIARVPLWSSVATVDSQPSRDDTDDSAPPWTPDAYGVVSVFRAQIDAVDRNHVWLVEADGYIAKQLVLDEGNVTTVVLDAASSAMVSCVNLSGEPLPGIVVALTQNADIMLTKQSIAAFNRSGMSKLGPGGSPSFSTWVAKTAANGIATFPTLRPGTYFVEPWSMTHATASFDGRLRVSSPGTLTVTFREVHCAVFRLEPSARMVTWMALRSNQAEALPPQFAFSGPAFWELRKRFPGACVLTSTPRDSGNCSARVAVIVDGYGRWDTTVELKPVSQLTTETVVELPDQNVVNCTRFRWATHPKIPLPDGVRPPRILLSGVKDGVAFEIMAEYGKTVVVPSTKLEVRAETFALIQSIELPKEIIVAPGEENAVWPLKTPLAPCSFSLVPDNGCWGPLDISIEASGSTAAWIPGYVREQENAWEHGITNQWLPLGPVALRMTRRGEELIVRADLGADGGVVECNVIELLARAASGR